MVESPDRLARKRVNSKKLRTSAEYQEYEKDYSKRYRAKPETKRKRVINQIRYERKKKYGLTDEDVQKLAESQNFQCAICETRNPAQWHIDHCHKTGKVRAILCNKCNVGLGWFLDSSELLIKASKYLIKHNKEK